ncbi:MAG: hypothetical protein ACLFVK_03235 [Dehalococcoidia bacterium]
MKALGLISGGLDSILALRLVLDQGIEVTAMHVNIPFIAEKQDIAKITAELGVPLEVVEVDEDYMEVTGNPGHGYGTGMNPCIDCRIYVLKKAKELADRIGASFLFTGEVLGERPMSQTRRALKIIDEESGLGGLILRPLSARLLPETIPESEGWVDRQKLMAIKGRNRKPQMALAEELGITHYPQPAGGCLLTQQEFSSKLRDLFQHKQKPSLRDIPRLEVGRHFRFEGYKIIVGRNEQENNTLQELKGPEDYAFEVPGHGSPITLMESSDGGSEE